MLLIASALIKSVPDRTDNSGSAHTIHQLNDRFGSQPDAVQLSYLENLIAQTQYLTYKDTQNLLVYIMQPTLEVDRYNYCEVLVSDRIKSMPEVLCRGTDFVNDVTCVALNRIKPRYIRERIYLFFHITDAEWDAIHAEVAEAVDFAVSHIGKNLRSAGNRKSEPYWSSENNGESL